MGRSKKGKAATPVSSSRIEETLQGTLKVTFANANRHKVWYTTVSRSKKSVITCVPGSPLSKMHLTIWLLEAHNLPLPKQLSSQS